MSFQHYNLGHLKAGDVVVFTLQGSAANVRLMQSTDFNNFRNGRRHHYHGGLQTKSPSRIAVPHSGTWHLTVDMQGLRGSTRSAVNVVPGSAMRPLPAMNEAPLRSVPMADDNVDVQQTTNALISHLFAEASAMLEDAHDFAVMGQNSRLPLQEVVATARGLAAAAESVQKVAAAIEVLAMRALDDEDGLPS